MKYGFRLIFHDDFLKTTLAPTLLPTLYLTAIPLRRDEPTITKMFYPDTIYEDKQVGKTIKRNFWEKNFFVKFLRGRTSRLGLKIYS